MGNIQLLIKEVVEQGPFINNVSKTYLLAKRVLDIVVSLMAVVLLSPVLIQIAIRIKISSRGPVLLTRERYGLRGMRFKTFEFVPMVKGHYIRRLPLLFNVLKGNLSIVGPQPTPLCELEKVDVWYYLRMSVKPGITGLWQVRGKCGEVNEIVRLDLKYIRERSLLYDMRIILTAIHLLISKWRASGKQKQ